MFFLRPKHLISAWDFFCLDISLYFTKTASRKYKGSVLNTLNLWEKLNLSTTVGIDSYCLKDYIHFKPSFGTTNPSIIRNHLVNEEATSLNFPTISLEMAILQESLPLLAAMKGPIALQVNPFFANHFKQTVENAKLLCHLFDKAGIDKSRYLIKIPATWEGIQAAVKLEKMGIKCIATTVFSLVQANTCAYYGISYIAPYVAKLQEAALIKKSAPSKKSHHGVELLQNMILQMKQYKSRTKVLAASFNTAAEVFSVCNADMITLKPKLALELQNSKEVPTLYSWKELSKVAHAKDKNDFDNKLLQDSVAPDLLAKTFSQFNVSWLTMRQLIMEKKEVLAAS